MWTVLDSRLASSTRPSLSSFSRSLKMMRLCEQQKGELDRLS